jgi:hypothetical protein
VWQPDGGPNHLPLEPDKQPTKVLAPAFATLSWATALATLACSQKQNNQLTHLKTPTKPNAQGDTTNKQHKPTTNTKHPTQTHTHPRRQPSLRGRQQKQHARPRQTDQIDTHHNNTHYIHWRGWLGTHPGTRLGITIF